MALWGPPIGDSYSLLRALKASQRYKWWVFSTIAIGTFVSVLDHGTVLVALPEIEEHFQSDLPTVQWIVVGYALAISVLILPMGRLGDILSRKHVYIAGLVVFVGASAMAGFATGLPMLIAAKVLQGIGSAMVQGNGMATVISAFPSSERGKALGTHMSVVGGGAIAGPAVGGLLIAAFGWRSVFFFNIPAGLIAIAASWYVLEQMREGAADRPGGRPAFDWLGAALSGMALLAFLLVVGNGDRQGWVSPTDSFRGGGNRIAVCGVRLVGVAYRLADARSVPVPQQAIRHGHLSQLVVVSWGSRRPGL